MFGTIFLKKYMGRFEGSEKEKFNITGQTDRVYLLLNLLTRNLFTILTLLAGGIQMLVRLLGHSCSWCIIGGIKMLMTPVAFKIVMDRF